MKILKSGMLLVLFALLITGCTQQAVGEDTIWMTDYDAALKQAAAENKYVLTDFSGSDWCSWCIKLDKEVFSKPEFIDYAKKNLILVMVDFPNSKPQSKEQKTANNALAKKYGIQGFPTVLIFNPQGEMIKRTGYQRGGPEPYIEMIKKAIK